MSIDTPHGRMGYVPRGWISQADADRIRADERAKCIAEIEALRDQEASKVLVNHDEHVVAMAFRDQTRITQTRTHGWRLAGRVEALEEAAHLLSVTNQPEEKDAQT